MLKNSDGTVQAQLPKTILFFTDGIPTKSRLDATSASAAAVADPLDVGPAGRPTTYLQIGWNRAERLIRDRGSIDIIGVYVSTGSNDTSDWITAGASWQWSTSRAATGDRVPAGTIRTSAPTNMHLPDAATTRPHV